MKRVYSFPTFCLLALACFLGMPGPNTKGDAKPAAESITVTMKSMSYDPETLEVHVGDSVVWANKSHTAHTATSDDEGKMFDTDVVDADKSSKAVKFEKEGEFKYHCKVHGRSMSGTVIVKPAEKK